MTNGIHLCLLALGYFCRMILWILIFFLGGARLIPALWIFRDRTSRFALRNNPPFTLLWFLCLKQQKSRSLGTFVVHLTRVEDVAPCFGESQFYICSPLFEKREIFFLLRCVLLQQQQCDKMLLIAMFSFYLRVRFSVFKCCPKAVVFQNVRYQCNYFGLHCNTQFCKEFFLWKI